MKKLDIFRDFQAQSSREEPLKLEEAEARSNVPDFHLPASALWRTFD